MTAVQHFDPGERLVAYAAVSVVPSLSWAHTAMQRRASIATEGPTLAFVHPGLPFADIAAELDNRQQPSDDLVVRATSLDDLHRRVKRPERRWAMLVVATHARLTPDQSVELYDHEGHTLGAFDLATLGARELQRTADRLLLEPLMLMPRGIYNAQVEDEAVTITVA